MTLDEILEKTIHIDVFHEIWVIHEPHIVSQNLSKHKHAHVTRCIINIATTHQVFVSMAPISFEKIRMMLTSVKCTALLDFMVDSGVKEL